MKNRRGVFTRNTLVRKTKRTEGARSLTLLIILGAWSLLLSPVFAENTGFVKHSSQLVLNDEANGNVLLDHSLVAFDQTVQAGKNSPQQIALNGGTVGRTQTKMIFSIVEEPEHGTLDKSRLAEGLVTYTPQPDFEGADTFLFTVDTGGEAAPAATVSLQVVPQKWDAGTGPVVAGGGSVSTDPLIIQLDEESDKFFKKQQETKREFMQELREKDLSSEEMQKRIIEFRQDETRKEQKFRQRRQKLLDKQGDEQALGILADADAFAQDLTLFFKLRDPSIEELDQQRSRFIEQQRQKRVKFLQDLHSEDLTEEERAQKIADFQSDFLEKERKFVEQRRKIIEKQAQDADLQNNRSDEELKTEIMDVFKELF